MTLTTDQLTDLREEFIEFKINEMTTEDMQTYIRDIMIHDVNVLNQEELERKVSKDIIVKVAVDEFGINHKPKIEHLVNLLHNETWEE